MEVFYQGIIIGLLIAIPVGPVGALCVCNTIKYGRLAGLATGFGAAVADAFYGAVAAFGLTLISDQLIANQHYIRFFGGLFLLYLGHKILKNSDKSDPKACKAEEGLAREFFHSLTLTLTNPATIIGFTAIFAAFGLDQLKNSYANAGIMVAGVFLGSAIWWIALSLTINHFHRANPKIMENIHKIAGIVVLVFGIIAIWSVFA